MSSRHATYWITGPWRGGLAIVPRPRGGDWLEDEIHAWKREGANVVVSTLTSDEVADFDLQQEGVLCEAEGLEFVEFPIPDRGIPSSMPAAVTMLRGLETKLSEGKTVLMHCRQGIGRSAMLAAALLVLRTIEVREAFERVSAARGCPVPETQEQREWLQRFAGEVADGSDS